MKSPIKSKKWFKTILFSAFAFIYLIGSVSAQIDPYIITKDSLSDLVRTADTEVKADQLIELFQHIFPRELELTDSILIQLDSIEKAFPNHERIIDIWIIKAKVFNYETKYDSLRIMSQKVLSVDNLTPHQQGKALNNLGIYEERVGSLDSALMYYEQSLAVSDFESYRLYNNLGRLYTRQNKIHKAIEYYEQAMQTAKSEGLLNAEAVIANNIGTSYENIDNLDKAIGYYKRSLELKDQLQDERGKLYALYNLALVIEDAEVAKEYTDLGLTIATKLDNGFFIEAFKMNLGRLLISKREYDKAEKILLPIYATSKGQPYGYNMTIEMSLAELYASKGEYDKAEKYLNDFYKYAESINATAEMQNVRTQFLTIYEAQKKYEDYYNVASVYYAIEDSIKSEASLQRFIGLEEKLDFEQNERVKLLNESIAEKEKSRFRLGLIGLLITAILMLLLYFRNKRIKYQALLIEQGKENEKKALELNKKLKDLDSLKTNFFTNVTHELRTPLSLILGPLQLLKSNTEGVENLEMINMIQRNAGRQLRLVNELLDLSKVDAGKMDIKLSENDLMVLIQNIINSYETMSTSRNIALELDSNIERIKLYYDRNKMEKIFYNILSNAFKYTPDDGAIMIKLFSNESKVDIQIIDSGIGIPENKISNIFDRFYQIDNGLNSKLESTGVGLSLTKELVEMHGGSISIKSKEGSGTTIFLSFLLGKDHLNDSDIVSRDEKYLPFEANNYIEFKEKDSITENEGAIKGDKNSSILIVEDNEDVRSFLTKVFSDTYNVFTSPNGKEGKEKAMEIMPDIIISDVMMPLKDGFEMCEELKQDINTSHIPVILLTAKTTHNEKIEGLGMGADAYVYKPFDPKEILIRVKNLLASRKILRSKFATSVTVKPSEVTTNSVDETFLKNALQIVEENIANENFSIENLSNLLNMSKPNLNRKLRAVVGQTSNKFIQSIRLQRAKYLLENKVGTIAEVGYKVGFSSPSYFVKCYKDKFGETPGKV